VVEFADGWREPIFEAVIVENQALQSNTFEEDVDASFKPVEFEVILKRYGNGNKISESINELASKTM
jgi:hypothetical protein